MLKFRVSDEERKLWDLPEVIEFDGRRFTNREADLLEAQVPDPADPTRTLTAARWQELLEGEVRLDGDGQPVVDPITGEPRMTMPTTTIGRMYWLALRRHGADVPWADFEFDLWGHNLYLDEDAELAEPDPGKEQAPPSQT